MTWRSDKNKRPTGIIRTLPYFGANEPTEEGAMRQAYKRMMEAFKHLESDGTEPVYVAMAQQPTMEVLYIYILVGGKIRVRANIAGYVPGSSVTIECWDGSLRKPKYWAVLSGPVSWPPEAIPMKGFQGFRYCLELW